MSLKNMNISFKYLLLFPLALISSCSQRHIVLEEGDLLFQDLNPDSFSNSIEAVTTSAGKRNFSHCGIVHISNDSAYVLEAIGKGVVLSPIDSFLSRSDEVRPLSEDFRRVSWNMKSIAVGRLKREYRIHIGKAFERGKELIGLPYDYPFEMNNGAYYCSELIYECFKGGTLFSLSPMTFKGRDGEFDKGWRDYFSAMGKAIPEGEPGITPGAISLSDKITLLN